MNAATITQAQDKGLRHDIADVFTLARSFCEQLFAAHGGWFFSARNGGASAKSVDAGRRELFSLAAQSESWSPSLAAELRHIAGRD